MSATEGGPAEDGQDAAGADLEFIDPLMRAHGDKIVQRCRRVLSRADAEDVLAEALLATARRRNNFADNEHATNYLYDVARKRVNSKLRRKAKEGQRHKPDGEMWTSEIVDHAAEFANMIITREAVQQGMREKLTEREYQVFRLRVFEFLTPAEISDALGITKGTVNGYFYDARAKLQQYLLECDKDEEAGR